MRTRARAYDDSHAHHRAMLRTIALMTAALTLAAVRFAHLQFAIRLCPALSYYYCHRKFNLRCQISVCDYKTEIAPLRFAPAGDSFGYNMMTVEASGDDAGAAHCHSIHIQPKRRNLLMSIDEKVEMWLVASGHDLESDEGARLRQEQIERELERERKRQWQQPPRRQEKIRGILL